MISGVQLEEACTLGEMQSEVDATTGIWGVTKDNYGDSGHRPE
jgi:hypothetical protein